MSQLIDALTTRAAAEPNLPFIQGKGQALSAAEILAEIGTLAPQLEGRCLGLLLDNGPAWAVADLAAILHGITCVPLPPFFSPAQMRHSLEDAGVDLLLTDRPESVGQLCGITPSKQFEVAGQPLALFHLPFGKHVRQLEGIAKITYTSGTTGTPKGVCLSLEAMEQVAHSIAKVAGAGPGDKSLSLLPLSTLLENIGGLYVPLLAGGCCGLLPMAEIGMHGASGLTLSSLLATLHLHRPSSVILIPQMLQALVEAAEAGTPLPNSLRFMAVGGAPVAESLLQRADSLGLPVFEGYGLSEASSVVAVNSPTARRIGTVGHPLPHVQVQVATDGEILLKGHLFNGYLGDPVTTADSFWPTGDLGHLDTDGFLHLTGRKKNIFITAFGRNVAPEWVERELLTQPSIAQVAVFGEAQPFNVAVIVPRPGADIQAITMAVAQTNEHLPDYARIGRYLIADEPFGVGNGQLTGTGRPRRSSIAAHYATPIDQLYKETA
jgi:long-subunit acyl-CoA synthetase (AMP-forming)